MVKMIITSKYFATISTGKLIIKSQVVIIENQLQLMLKLKNTMTEKSENLT